MCNFSFFVLSRSCVLERCTFAICIPVTFLKKCCSATVCISTSRNLNFFQQSANLKIAALQLIAEVRNLKKLENCDCGLSKLDFRTFCNMQHDIGKIWWDPKLLLKGTVSPDIGLYFRFWKKISTSCRTAYGYNIFNFLVPEILIFELILWKHSTMVQTLPKAVPESTFRLTDIAVRTPAGFRKLLVYCESGFRKPFRKATGGFQ